MRRLVLAACFAASGCGAQPLPSTLFFTQLAPDATLDDGSWAALATGAHCDEVSALAAGEPDTWVLWCAHGAEVGVLLRVRRTSLGLEVQSIGRHSGPSVRPTIRALSVGRALVVIVESSSDAQSTERLAWLYVERGARIVPLTLDDAPARVRVRAERIAPLGSGWSRAETLTATIDAGTGGLFVHEHASVREIADGRPELPARATYEVERARFLRGNGDALEADRASLFDDAS
jgi:hypothetical protein